MTLPPKLQKELEELAHDYQIDIAEDGDWVNLVFRTFVLGDGFNCPTSDLLIRVPRSYPDAGPDMFWVETSVLLSTGKAPQSAESIEGPYSERRWRRFSWHRKGWNSAVDNIHGHLEFIRKRLREKK